MDGSGLIRSRLVGFLVVRVGNTTWTNLFRLGENFLILQSVLFLFHGGGIDVGHVLAWHRMMVSWIMARKMRIARHVFRRAGFRLLVVLLVDVPAEMTSVSLDGWQVVTGGICIFFIVFSSD